MTFAASLKDRSSAAPDSFLPHRRQAAEAVIGRTLLYFWLDSSPLPSPQGDIVNGQMNPPLLPSACAGAGR